MRARHEEECHGQPATILDALSLLTRVSEVRALEQNDNLVNRQSELAVKSDYQISRQVAYENMPTEQVSNSSKRSADNNLGSEEKESIVTKRVAHGELSSKF